VYTLVVTFTLIIFQLSGIYWWSGSSITLLVIIVFAIVFTIEFAVILFWPLKYIDRVTDNKLPMV
jgi:hypothetical protein